jgi:hypothetical protein
VIRYLLAIERDLLARVLAKQDRVAVLQVERPPVTIVAERAVADRVHLAALGLLLGGVRDDDAAAVLFALVETLNENAVV